MWISSFDEGFEESFLFPFLPFTLLLDDLATDWVDLFVFADFPDTFDFMDLEDLLDSFLPRLALVRAGDFERLFLALDLTVTFCFLLASELC